VHWGHVPSWTTGWPACGAWRSWPGCFPSIRDRRRSDRGRSASHRPGGLTWAIDDPGVGRDVNARLPASRPCRRTRARGW
jgi:hypothetical protein